MSVSLAQLRAALPILQDGFAALRDRLGNIGEDIQFVEDVAALVALIDPPLAPAIAAAEELAPVAEIAIGWIVANAEPAPPAERSGARGSNPWDRR